MSNVYSMTGEPLPSKKTQRQARVESLQLALDTLDLLFIELEHCQASELREAMVDFEQEDSILKRWMDIRQRARMAGVL